MEWLLYVVGVLFVLAGAVCVALVVVQLPGAWIMLGLAGVIEYCDRFYLPPGNQQTFGWWVLGACLVLLVIGELIEFLAAALGAQKGGGSRRGMMGALIGAVAGALLLTPLFFFAPIFGALLGTVAGTFIGAIVGELSTRQTTLQGSIKPAVGATVGRVVGTMSKVAIALGVWIALSISVFWH